MRFGFIGDIVGKPGRIMLKRHLKMPLTDLASRKKTAMSFWDTVST
jgi:calcineurin-like phosphoesterase